ncbi:hypothetical protein MMC25_006891 [Agyrium rufum]|nr:hypothetical protein [Agyrium rufum]
MVNSQATFTYPAHSDDYTPVWSLGQSINFTWTTEWDAVDIQFQAEDSSFYLTFGTNITDDYFEWIVNVNNSGSANNTEYYYFFLAQTSNTSNYVTSDAIQLVPTNLGPVTTSLATTAEQTAVPTTVLRFTSEVTVTATSIVTITLPPSAGTSLSSSGGLSEGAKIAIGVVIPVAVIVIAGALYFWWFRTRKRRATTQTTPEAAGHNANLQGGEFHEEGRKFVEAPGSSAQRYNEKDGVSRAEMGDIDRVEMSAYALPSEMYGMDMRHELEANEQPQEVRGDVSEEDLRIDSTGHTRDTQHLQPEESKVQPAESGTHDNAHAQDARVSFSSDGASNLDPPTRQDADAVSLLSNDPRPRTPV